MRKQGGTPSRRDKHVTLAAISPPGVARGRFVGGQQSGLAGSKPPPLFTREASSCSSQGRRQGEPWGASPRPSAPTYLPTLKDIKPPMYDGNPLNLDRFLEKLNDWGLTVTEDLPPADAERYVFRRFRYRLPEVLGELYFVATKEGRIKTLKEAKKWLNEQERVGAPQVAAKRWKSIKLEHDGREIRLRDWRDFRGKYTLFRRNVEDWNEGDEQARLLSMLPEAWIKRVTKEESKRAKSNHRSR